MGFPSPAPPDACTPPPSLRPPTGGIVSPAPPGGFSPARPADEPNVEVEPAPGDVPGLPGAEPVSRPANLKIFQRPRHARAELVVLCDRREPVIRRLGQRDLGRIQEIRVATLTPAADPAAQLM